VGEDDATLSSRGGGGRVLVLVASWVRTRERGKERARRRVVLVVSLPLSSSLRGGGLGATGDGDSGGARMPFVFGWRGQGAVNRGGDGGSMGERHGMSAHELQQRGRDGTRGMGMRRQGGVGEGGQDSPHARVSKTVQGRRACNSGKGGVWVVVIVVVGRRWLRCRRQGARAVIVQARRPSASHMGTWTSVWLCRGTVRRMTAGGARAHRARTRKRAGCARARRARRGQQQCRETGTSHLPDVSLGKRGDKGAAVMEGL
jgi:hypothetical protein